MNNPFTPDKEDESLFETKGMEGVKAWGGEWLTLMSCAIELPIQLVQYIMRVYCNTIATERIIYRMYMMRQ